MGFLWGWDFLWEIDVFTLTNNIFSRCLLTEFAFNLRSMASQFKIALFI